MKKWLEEESLFFLLRFVTVRLDAYWFFGYSIKIKQKVDWRYYRYGLKQRKVLTYDIRRHEESGEARKV